MKTKKSEDIETTSIDNYKESGYGLFNNLKLSPLTIPIPHKFPQNEVSET